MSHNAKLSEEEVQQIRQLLMLNNYHKQKWGEVSHERIAEKFDVHASRIRSIANGESYSTVGLIEPVYFETREITWTKR